KRTANVTPNAARGAKKTGSARLSPGAFCFYLQELRIHQAARKGRCWPTPAARGAGGKVVGYWVREPVQKRTQARKPASLWFHNRYRNAGRMLGGRGSCRILVHQRVRNAQQARNPQVFGFTSVIPQLPRLSVPSFFKGTYPTTWQTPTTF